MSGTRQTVTAETGTAGADSAAFHLSAYLDRVDLNAPPPATAGGLERLVRAHRLAIPFENLDIPLGRGISIDPAAVFGKLVRRRRGGYCFEQNGLLDMALAALGFEARPLLARVWLGVGAEPVTPLTHQLELVRIDGRDWIADAGFGGSWCPPMPLAEMETDPGPDGARHRLRQDERLGWMLERRGPGECTDGRGDGGPEWQRQYSFTLAEAHAIDREMSNHWTSTRPCTRFTTLAIASRVLEQGFLSLTGRVLRDSDGSEKTLETATALRDALIRHFGIVLDEDEIERLFAFTDTPAF